MLCKMQEEGRLKTPGLLLSSVELAHSVTPRAPGSLPQRSEASAVSAIRESLDRGEGVSSSPSSKLVGRLTAQHHHGPAFPGICRNM